MKAFVLTVALILSASGAFAASHSVKAHVTRSGTFVAATRATNPNRSKLDNYSTKGNVNPFNGRRGTRAPKP